MTIFSKIVTDHALVPGPALLNRVALPFDARQRSRLRVIVTEGPFAGRAVGIDLPRGSMMRGGTVLSDNDGHWLCVDAAPEALLQARSDSPRELARLAYHLGNRHVAVQVGEGWLRLQQDHVLEQMLQGLGARPIPVDDCFEPEGGAYGQAGAHSHGHSHDHAHDQAHSHSHDHSHDHPHDHPHDHHHRAEASPETILGAALPDRRHAPRIHDLADPAATLAGAGPKADR